MLISENEKTSACAEVFMWRSPGIALTSRFCRSSGFGSGPRGASCWPYIAPAVRFRRKFSRFAQCHKQKDLVKITRSSYGAVTGNRTRNRGTTNPCDNRFTMTAMVHPAGLEPATLRLEPSCSIQLSYGCMRGNITLY